MTKYSRSTLKKRIVLTAPRLKELNSILLKYCQHLQYSITTKNQSRVYFNDFDELSGYVNYGEDKIRSLKIEGREILLAEPIITIEFSPKTPYAGYSTILYCMFSDTDKISIFSNDIRKFIDKAAEYNTSYSACKWAGLILFILLGLYFAYSHFSGKIFGIFNIFLVIMEFLLSELVAIMLYAAFSILVWQKLFPRVVFAWGEEEQKYQRLKNLRSNLFWVVLIGAVISVLVAFIF
ncbi:MAG: hypothetical protein IKH03_04590 [Oscillospiraceae bacterium]|nr:hypothetical protein [Oscillospiraceae bacterium]